MGIANSNFIKVGKDNKKCPNCGYYKKKKIPKKNLAIIGIALVILIICGVLTGILIHNQNVKKQHFYLLNIKIFLIQ